MVSGSFTNKFNKNKEADTDDGAAEREKKRKNHAAKQNPLLNAKTDQYVDDNQLFVSRIAPKDKLEYWAHLLAYDGKRPLPPGVESWKKKEIATEHELDNYSKIHIRLFNFVRTAFWDQICLNIFILWLVMISFFEDGFAESMAPSLLSLKSTVYTVFPLLMFFTQLIPFLGTIYCVNFYNDLVNYIAIKEIGSWAFVSALTAQYIEFFHYQGRNRSDKAGKCRKDPPHHLIQQKPAIKNFMQSFARDSQVVPVDEDGSNDEEGGEGSKSSNDEEGDGNSREEEEDNEQPRNDIEHGRTAGSDGGDKRSNKNPTASSSSARPTGKGAGAGTPAGEKQTSSALVVAPGGDDGEGDEEEKEEVPDELNPELKRIIVTDPATGEEMIQYVQREFTDWTCLVCNTQNHRPTECEPEYDIVFGEKGLHYKRTYAKIQGRRTVPTCIKCFTYFDYQPPMGSAHIFPHNPAPHHAFEEFPKKSAVQAGLKPDRWSRFYNQFKSFFIGIKNDYESAPLHNDWRLRKFANHHFPELPRYILKSGEQYREGEIVECKQQRFDWARARILVVYSNKTYDIRYDPGDELRFVAEKLIRTVPEKRAFAYRVEMGMVLISLLTPLGLFLGMSSGNYGMALMGVLVAGVGLLVIRLVNLIQYFYNYYHAGLNVILQLSAIYTVPILFLTIGGAVGLTGGADPASWGTIFSMLILAKVSSLPALYILRPPYCVLGAVVFVQTSIGMILLSLYVTGQMDPDMIIVPFAPFLSAALILKWVRRQLHNIWDVCLVIRPARDTSEDNPSIFVMMKDAFMEYFDL
eukprot:CAMPEP_0174965298 /NCGR_PEP_ID=MMETSP0004_2-20121128/6359_1 /TAXON_ID=420556 /ORGANISM="Ochromonas sp., Strain CCMP1393" /LENGTH=803 /DNA_ID=CAMNT_0016214121 /DNA_START=124 /DNA_END=2538 /DNA_ORIENTATION=-